MSSSIQISLNLHFSGYLTSWPQMTFDLDLWPFDRMNIWRLAYYINKPSLVQIWLQLFKWGHFHIFSLSYNLTSDNLWPSYMTFDLIHKCGFPCSIYDPTLVEIHQSMWKVEPNVNLFSQQTTAYNNNNNNSRQSDPYVSFLLRQATQKAKGYKSSKELFYLSYHGTVSPYVWRNTSVFTKGVIISSMSPASVNWKLKVQGDAVSRTTQNS